MTNSNEQKQVIEDYVNAMKDSKGKLLMDVTQEYWSSVVAAADKYNDVEFAQSLVDTLTRQSELDKLNQELLNKINSCDRCKNAI